MISGELETAEDATCFSLTETESARGETLTFVSLCWFLFSEVGNTQSNEKKNHYHGNKDRWPKFTYVCLVKRRHSFLTSIFHKLIFFFLGTTYVFTTNPFKNTRNTLLKEQHFCELLQIYIKKIHIKRVWLFMLKLLFYKTKKQSWLWMAEDVSIHIWKIMFILLNFEDVSSLALAKQAYLACHWYLTIPLTKFWYNHWENLSK